MKRRTILGIGASAVIGVVGGVSAILFSPKHGEERRAVVKEKSGSVIRRERAHITALLGQDAGVSHQKVTDAKLAEQVRYALQEVFGDETDTVDLVVKRGLITIKGEVEKLADIEEADSIIRSVDGVKDVNNLLRLKAQMPRPHRHSKSSPHPAEG